jgi:hypothetical protein
MMISAAIAGLLFVCLPDILSAYSDNSSGLESDRAGVDLQMNPWKHQVGVSASMISGHGIHYLMPVSNTWAVKFSMVGIYDTDNRKDVLVFYNENSQQTEDILLTDWYYNLGMEMRRYLYTTEKLGMFVIGGSYYSHSRSDFIDSEYGYDWMRQSKQTNLKKHIAIGTGLGIERRFSGVIEVNFDVGYIFRARTDVAGEYSLRLGSGIGIGYRF